MNDTNEYIQTHKSLILHIKNNPVACIVEENNENKSKYLSIEKKSEIKASIRGFLNKHEGCRFVNGI